MHGGAQIIDVKNPLQGPLGRAKVETVREILAVLSDATHRQTISAALGETQEWMRELSGEQQEWMAFLHSCPSLQFLKLGTAGLLSESAVDDQCGQSTVGADQVGPAVNLDRTSDVVVVDWDVSLESVRRKLLGSVTEGSESPVAGGSDPMTYPAWISVAYADSQRCNAPSPDAVVAEAVRSGGCGLLVDTFVKDGSRLLDWCSISTLVELRRITRASRLLLAVAGQLRIDDLERLVPIAPDIIAVRGAVCQQGLRTSGVREVLVREFADAVSECFGTTEVFTPSGTLEQSADGCPDQ